MPVFIEGELVSQARPTFHKPVLGMIMCIVLHDGAQGDLFHDLPDHWGQTDRPVSPLDPSSVPACRWVPHLLTSTQLGPPLSGCLMEDGLVSSSTSYLSVLAWMLCGPIDLQVSKWYSRFLTFFPMNCWGFILFPSFWASIFQLRAQVSWLHLALLWKTEKKEILGTIAFSSSFVIMFLPTSTKGQRFSLALLALQLCLQKPFLITFYSSNQLSSGSSNFFPAQPQDIQVALQSSLLLLPV